MANGRVFETVTFEQTEEDAFAFVRHTMFDVAPGKYALLGIRGFYLAVPAVVFHPWSARTPTELAVRMALWTVGALLLWRHSSRRLERSIRLNPDQGDHAIPGEWTVRIGGEGVSHSHQRGSATASWRSIKRIDETPAGIYFFTGPRAALIVPSHAFPGPDEMQRFAETARALWTRHRDEPR